MAGHERRTDLSQLDGKLIAFELPNDGRSVLRGVGVYEKDESLGFVLRVVVERATDKPFAGAAILISDREWNGPIIADSEHGCDYIFRLALKTLGEPSA